VHLQRRALAAVADRVLDQADVALGDDADAALIDGIRLGGFTVIVRGGTVSVPSRRDKRRLV